MWSEVAFQVGPQDVDDLVDDDVNALRGFPGIDGVSVDTGRHLVFVRYDASRWTPIQLAAFFDELGWEWQPVLAEAA